MKIYLVGGAVRDKILDLPVQEKDWVVIGSTVDEMLSAGYKQVGKDFPVFLHPETKEEYALARTERKSGRGYKGFTVHASPDVTLEEDLLRRDLTINAIAESEDGQLIDPFNGQEDLQNGLLRHVSPAFAEDPVRILRIARFAARFSQWGFKVAHSTNALMRKMVADGEVDYLVPERVWAELSKALATDNPQKFFQVLRGCNALEVLFPEINATYLNDESAHTKIDLPKPLLTLKSIASKTNNSKVRFAGLMFGLCSEMDPVDQNSAIDTLCKRVKAPNDFHQLAQKCVAHAKDILSNNPEKLLLIYLSTRALKQPELWHQMCNTYLDLGHITQKQSEHLENLRVEISRVNASYFTDRNITGPDLGKAIKNRQLSIIRERFTE